MAYKISTLILKVDLDCHLCYKKIRKILCELQDRERISTISYHDQSNTITLVGPFDPHKLSCKIRCKGGKVIKDIYFMDDGQPAPMAAPPPPQPMSDCKKKKKKKSKGKPSPPPMYAEQPPPQPAEQPPPPAERPPSPAERPPSPPHQPAPPDREMAAPMPAFDEQEMHIERPAELESPPPREKPVDYAPAPAPMVQIRESPRARPPPPPAMPCQPADMTTMVEIPSRPGPPPSWSAPPVERAGRPCGCQGCTPCYQGYYEGCRCWNCGRVYSFGAGVTPRPLAGCYSGNGVPYGGGYRGCQIVCEEDPAAACAIM